MHTYVCAFIAGVCYEHSLLCHTKGYKKMGEIVNANPRPEVGLNATLTTYEIGWMGHLVLTHPAT